MAGADRGYRRPGVSQTELADMLEIDRASAGRMIDRMEKNGWVERRPDNGDRRINRLHLTADARKVHTAMWAIADRRSTMRCRPCRPTSARNTPSSPPR